MEMGQTSVATGRQKQDMSGSTHDGFIPTRP